LKEAKMLAVVKYAKGPGNVELREVPVPKPREDEVLIKVMAASICGSDLHIYHDEHPYWPPVIMGHEFSGEIVEVGANVKEWQVGDRVVAEPHTRTCGTCLYCRTGNQQVCVSKRAPGWGIDGAFAEYLAYPARLLHRIPDEVSFEEAACAEPMSICVHGVLERSLHNSGDTTCMSGAETVLISGPGPIGLLATQVLRAAGVGTIIVSGTPRSAKLRLPKALEVGADITVNVGEEDLVEKVMRVTDGRGVDLVVECSGAQKAIEQAFKCVRRLGKVCFIGIAGSNSITIPFDEAIFKAANVTFCFSHRYTSWETTLGLMAKGLVTPKKIITHKGPLSNWEEFFSALEHGEAVKAILLPQEK